MYSGIYETPGGTILLAAHMDLEVFTLDRVTHDLFTKLCWIIYNDTTLLQIVLL